MTSPNPPGDQPPFVPPGGGDQPPFQSPPGGDQPPFAPAPGGDQPQYQPPSGPPPGEQPSPYGPPPGQGSPYGAPPGQPAPYGAPGQPPFGSPPPAFGAPVQTQSSNGKAIASLVLGILSILCLGILAGIPAIILGNIAKKEIDQGRGGGRGMAQAGFILGIIGTVFGSLWIILVIIGAATS